MMPAYAPTSQLTNPLASAYSRASTTPAYPSTTPLKSPHTKPTIPCRQRGKASGLTQGDLALVRESVLGGAGLLALPFRCHLTRGLSRRATSAADFRRPSIFTAP